MTYSADVLRAKMLPFMEPGAASMTPGFTTEDDESPLAFWKFVELIEIEGGRLALVKRVFVALYGASSPVSKTPNQMMNVAF